MPGIDLAEFAERIRTLNAPEQGMNYRGAHSGERRYNEFDGKEYYTRGEPATLTVYGERAQLLYDLIRNCAEIAAALSTPVAQGDEVREALERIDKFVTDYLSPWGSWKTPWWEGEVSDEAAFSDDNALKHCANIARSALATLTKGARDAG